MIDLIKNSYNSFSFKFLFRFIKISLLLVIISCIVTLLFISRPSSQFPQEYVLKVKPGDTSLTIAPSLEEHSIIRSSSFFIGLMKVVHKGELIAGDYLFNKPISTLEVARRLREGDFSLETVSITIPEGVSTQELSDILMRTFPHFDSALILKQTQENVGYLFPDTYIVPITITEKELIERMKSTFIQKTSLIKKETENKGKSWNDIIIMASILEKEAHDEQTRKIIAGILWKRLEKDMRLQVDAPFLALEGKGSAEITQRDLFNNSLYNTYRNKGLPPTPITNPGIETIQDALYPIPSDYLFYLADSEGKTHFSTTFEEHVNKKDRYIKD